MRAALLLAAALLAAPAAAGADDFDPAPLGRPVAPLGWRFGVGSVVLDGDTRFAAALGLARGTTIGGVRVTGEYTIELLSGSAYASPTDTMPVETSGTGHHLRALARHELWGTKLNKGRIYLDGELGAGALYAFDSVAGRVLAPEAIAGIRIGSEVFTTGPSPARSMDGVLTIRLSTDGDAVGIMVATGLDLGR